MRFLYVKQAFVFSFLPTSQGVKAVRVQGRHLSEGSKDDAHPKQGGPVGYVMKKRKKFHPPLSWQRSAYRESMGSMFYTTSLSYPAHSIEGELNMLPCRFHNYRFFQLLILTHTIHKKIHRLPSFRDKSPC